MENLPNERLVLTPHAIKRHTRRLQQEIQHLFSQDNKTNLTDFTLSQSQNMLARILGMNDYHEMHKVLFNESLESMCSEEKFIIDEHENMKKIFNNITFPPDYQIMNFNEFISQIAHIEDIKHILLQSDSMIGVNHNGNFYNIQKIPSKRDLESMIIELYGSDMALSKLRSGNDIDFPYQLAISRDLTVRFRINFTQILSQGQKGYSITITKLMNKTPEINTLILDKNLQQILNIERGIAIIGGHSGAEKIELLHAFLQNKINKESVRLGVYQYIIDYIYRSDNTLSTVSQLDVNSSLGSMEQAIRNASRRNLDVVMFEEIRTPEHIRALTTMNSYNSVYTTMNTSSVEDTLMRILNSLNNDKQEYIEFLSNLSLIVHQTVIRNKNKKPAYIQSYLELNQNIKDIITDFVLGNNFSTELFRSNVKEIVNTYGVNVEVSLKEALARKLISEDDYHTYVKRYKS